jgi:hypothetical protein
VRALASHEPIDGASDQASVAGQFFACLIQYSSCLDPHDQSEASQTAVEAAG